MTAIPEELQRLWRERDQAQTTLPVITLEDPDETPSEVVLDTLEDTLENTAEDKVENGAENSVENRAENLPASSPMLPAYSGVKDVACFPSYNLISDINLSKYESHYERRLLRTNTNRNARG
jgi:hypothetical protein